MLKSQTFYKSAWKHYYWVKGMMVNAAIILLLSSHLHSRFTVFVSQRRQVRAEHLELIQASPRTYPKTSPRLKTWGSITPLNFWQVSQSAETGSDRHRGFSGLQDCGLQTSCKGFKVRGQVALSLSCGHAGLDSDTWALTLRQILHSKHKRSPFITGNNLDFG